VSSQWFRDVGACRSAQRCRAAHTFLATVDGAELDGRGAAAQRQRGAGTDMGLLHTCDGGALRGLGERASGNRDDPRWRAECGGVGTVWAQVFGPDAKGIKTVIEYKVRDDGAKVR
jgi:hypothetical protein